jgi:hypothetical protein
MLTKLGIYYVKWHGKRGKLYYITCLHSQKYNPTMLMEVRHI